MSRHHVDECAGGAHGHDERCFCKDGYHYGSIIIDPACPVHGSVWPIKKTTLPTSDADRKKLPIFDGVLKYFPDALLAIAEVSRIGNEQHNPGEPLHWAKDKSTDHFNTNIRHQLDHATGTRYDVDGARHLAKAAWRILAALQTDIENERNGK